MGKTTTCSIEGCEKRHLARGFCNRHYQNWRRTGVPTTATARYYTPEDAFRAYTEWSGDCLLWTGGKTKSGYGSLNTGGTNLRAHRYAWERVHGPIPDGMYVDHTCWNRACVEVSHLRLATPQENGRYREGANRNSTTGIRGVHMRRGKFRAAVHVDGEPRFLGTFATEEEAARVVREFRTRHFGAYAGGDGA